jgi:hypothetical protein
MVDQDTRKSQIRARIDSSYAEIKSEVEARGAVWTSNGGFHGEDKPGWNNIHVDGVSVNVDIREQRAPGWSLSGNGKLSCSYGPYGSQKTRPEGKNGFKVADIARDLILLAQDQKIRNATEEQAAVQKRESQVIVDRLLSSYGVERFGFKRIDNTDIKAINDPSRVTVVVTLDLSEDQARTLISFVKQFSQE